MQFSFKLILLQYVYLCMFTAKLNKETELHKSTFSVPQAQKLHITTSK